MQTTLTRYNWTLVELKYYQERDQMNSSKVIIEP